MAEHEEHGGSHGKSHGHGGGGGHGGGHEEGHEGAPEWLISFADNVALMMGFFVLLLAMNMKPPTAGAPSDKQTENASSEQNNAMLDWALAIREAFNNPVTVNSVNPADQVLVRRLLEKVGKGDAKEKGQRGSHDSTTALRPNQYYSSGGVVTFDDDKADVGPAQRAAVADIAAHIRGLRNQIYVQGHVSKREAYTLEAHGMKLSYERAFAIAKLLVEQGIEWEQLRVMEAGDADPVASHAYDDAAHRNNQRVEVLVTHLSIDENKDEKNAAANTPNPPASSPAAAKDEP